MAASKPYTVESGIDVPVGARCRKYPFDEMHVGDSFDLHGAKVSTVRSAASYYGKRNEMKFSIYQHGDTYRCWRVS